ncbi:MAG: hypothetical protein JW927_04625 [Deltaproteobacteria bacterium]|nr:hypothetical protein [Deltaproteobacteria bacterium]
MKIKYITAILLLCCGFAYAAGPVLPVRVGGSVTVDGELLNAATGKGFVFRVTAMDGKDFTQQALDSDGLNGAGKYIIDIPVHDPVNQPGGAKPESRAIIHVYKDKKALKVISPVNGEFTVGRGGSITIIDLVVSAQ